MKKIRIAIGLLVVSVFFLSASIWEGTAVTAPGDEFPQGGFFTATNAFPPNTEVYITNLVNGKTVRAFVTAGLDSPAFLAMISRDAAAVMDIYDQAVARIRIIHPSDITLFSRFTETINFGRSNLQERLAGTSSGILAPEPLLVQPASPAGETGRVLPSEDIPDIMAAAPRPEERTLPGLSLPQGPTEPAETISGTPIPSSEGIGLRLLPSEERPPAEAGSRQLPTGAEIVPLETVPVAQTESVIDPALIIPSLESVSPSPVQIEDYTGSRSAFSVPVIEDLERGRYYLQLRAFGKAELVEAELSRIGNDYPLVIQKNAGGVTESSVYRVLVGPVSLGESGALLHRFKSIGYTDAFIRQGYN
jgi:hypothetical protein